MKRGNLLVPIGAAAGMLTLILDSRTALAGAKEGMELCFQSVIPSLFPFFVLSTLVTSYLSSEPLRLLKWLARLCRIPYGSESIVIPAFLGGYPVGASSVSQCVEDGLIDKEDGRVLLAYCNQAGPAFLFGVVRSSLSSTLAVWACWMIVMSSALAVAWVLPECHRQGHSAFGRRVTISQAISSSVRTMGLVCGWIVLFRILIAFLDRWFLWLLPKWLAVLVCGILELTNGCFLLDGLESPALQFVLCCGMVSFGGVCVAMQTRAVSGEIPMDLYYGGKVLQSLLSMVMAAACVFKQWWMLSAWLILFAFGFAKNRGRIREAIPV